jgi:hypothetical protein
MPATETPSAITTPGLGAVHYYQVTNPVLANIGERAIAQVIADYQRAAPAPFPSTPAPGMRGARGGTAEPPLLPEHVHVPRRISVRGAIMIGGQRIQVGLPHAGKTADHHRGRHLLDHRAGRGCLHRTRQDQPLHQKAQGI